MVLKTSFPLAGSPLRFRALRYSSNTFCRSGGAANSLAARSPMFRAGDFLSSATRAGSTSARATFRASTASRKAGTQLFRLSSTSVAVARTLGVMAGQAVRIIPGARSSPNRPRDSRAATWMAGGWVALRASASTGAASANGRICRSPMAADPGRVRLAGVLRG